MIMNKVLDAACRIFIPVNKISAGKIIKPPPIPSMPVNRPTNTPINNNISWKLDFVKIGLDLNNDKDDNNITTENSIINQ